MHFTRPLVAAVALVLPLTGRGEVVAVPGGLPANVVVQRDGTTTILNLSGPARLDWSLFQVKAGETLQYASVNNRAFPSLNVVNSGQAGVHGSIRADGPFYLISPGGIQVGATGRINAPQILLSALRPANADSLLDGTVTSFTPSGNGGVGINGRISTSGGPVVIVGSTVSLGPNARISAPGGRVQVIAADKRSVAGSGQGGFAVSASPDGTAGGGSGQISNSGWIEARRVELLSDGFIRNAGRLVTTGAANEVVLSAGDIAHELRPATGAVISTSRLTTNGTFRQEGPVINPNDGANPAPSGGLRQTPRLSGSGFLTTVSAGQTQLSNAPLQSARTQVSPIPPPLPRTTNTLAARRRGSSEEPARPVAKSSSPPVAARPAPAAKSVRKAAFFGQTIRR